MTKLERFAFPIIFFVVFVAYVMSCTINNDVFSFHWMAREDGIYGMTDGQCFVFQRHRVLVPIVETQRQRSEVVSLLHSDVWRCAVFRHGGRD